MVLWIAMAVLAAAASLPVLMALARAGTAKGAMRRPDMAVYRDQLDEIDRDIGRGLIGETEADAARTEVARRLIRAGEQGPAASPHGSRSAARVAAAGIVLAPLAALAIYLVVGAPELADQPLASRMAAPLAEQDVGALVGRVETHLANNPEDGEGWEIVGPVYLRLSRYDDAVRAFSNALRILGPSAFREASLGEAIVRANGGVITGEATAAFERARQLDPEDPRPRFFLAIALSQEGRQAEAIAAWRELLAGAPPQAPWVAAAQAELAALTGIEGPPPAPGRAQQDVEAAPAMTTDRDSAPAPGPDRQDVEAASAMTPDERLAMIEGMIGGLAARLETDSADADGWARLIRSYMVLGRPADASDALAKARAGLAGDAEKLATVDEVARAMGVEE